MAQAVQTTCCTLHTHLTRLRIGEEQLSVSEVFVLIVGLYLIPQGVKVKSAVTQLFCTCTDAGEERMQHSNRKVQNEDDLQW